MRTIVPANTAHIPAIKHITAAVWPATYYHIIGEEQVHYMLDLFYTPAALAKQMQEDGHTFVLLEDAGEPIGFAAYSQISPGTWKLHKLYVLPSAQGTGAGKFLLHYLLQDIRSKGATQLVLNVNIHNHPAIAFYERMGFVLTYSEDIEIGNGYYMNDHVYQLSL